MRSPLSVLFALLSCLLCFGAAATIPYTDCLRASPIVNATSGQISDGPGDYASDLDCRILIAPAGNHNGVSLQFDFISIEDGYDSISVYDGDVEDGDALLATYDSSVVNPPALYSISPKMLVIFTSDSSKQFAGFQANYTQLSYIPYNCSALSSCSGHGECLQNATCSCFPGYHGTSCSLTFNCSGVSNCSGKGLCIATNVCMCDDGRAGTRCTDYSYEGFCTGDTTSPSFTTLTNQTGNLTDGPGDYQSEASCSFLIAPEDPILGLVLYFDDFDTEVSYDQLYIYAENSTDADPLMTLSGELLSIPPFYTPLKSLLLVFEADSATQSSGFKIRYSATPFIPYNCSEFNYCNSHGNCSAVPACICFEGWEGTSCDRVSNCSLLNDCGGRGFCFADNQCRCIDGWAGSGCTEYLSFANCTGNSDSPSAVTLQSPTGIITDGPGAYSTYAQCSFLIQPNQTEAVQGLMLNFTLLDTESCCDFVNIYRVPVSSENLIASYSGKIIPPVLYTNDSSVMVVFSSDSSQQGAGFEIVYSVTSFIPYNCSRYADCNGHGVCQSDAHCLCNDSWTGPFCNETFDCRQLSNCSGNGICIQDNTCRCSLGYGGFNCSHALIPYDCSYFNDCSGHGNCTVQGDCSCSAEYTSLDCSQRFDCSLVANCSNLGLCIGNNNCSCIAGWTSSDCSSDVNECDSEPCLFGGTCNNSPGSYTCTCPASRDGVNCEIEKNFEDLYLANIFFPDDGTWVVPVGVSEIIISVWGCGGAAEVAILASCDCSANAKVYCPGGKGGSGGFTKKRVAVEPGANYTIFISKSYEDTLFYKTSQPNVTLAQASCGGTGGSASARTCSGGTCDCWDAYNGNGGEGEDLSAPDVLESIQGCHIPSWDQGCCSGTTSDGFTAGKGSCVNAPPGSSYWDRILGDPGMIIITPRVRKYPISLEASQFVHGPSLQVKIHDSIFIKILLVDIRGTSLFNPSFSGAYAANITISYQNTQSGDIITLQPTPLDGPGYNFFLSFSYAVAGEYDVWATFEGSPFGEIQRVVVGNALLVLPPSIAQTVSMGSIVTVPVSVANIGNLYTNWTTSIEPSVPWLSLDSNSAEIRAGELQTLTVMFSLSPGSLDSLVDTEVTLNLNSPGQDPILVPISLHPVPGPTSPQDSFLVFSSNSVAIDELLTFTLVTYDEFGFPRGVGGDQFSAGMLDHVGQDVHPSLFSWDYFDLGNGNYTCTLTFRGSKGTYTLVPSLRILSDEEVIGVPVQLTVTEIQCQYPEIANTQGNLCVCRPGLYRTISSTCEPCSLKTFKNTSGDDPCTSCPPNTYSNGTHCLCVENALLFNGTCLCRAGFDGETGCSQNCRSGTFSIDGSPKCLECDSDGTSCSDGTMKVLPGFWWSGEFNGNTSLLACLKKVVCQPTNAEFTTTDNPPEASCLEGHDPQSPLCAVCMPGYASSGGDSICHKCWHPGWSWLVLILVLVAIGLVAWAVLARTGKNRSISSVLLRILINYVQVTFLFSKFKNNGNELFYNIFSFPTSAGNGFSIDFFPVQCALGWDYYARWAFYMSLPPAILLLPAMIFYFDFKFLHRIASNFREYETKYKAVVIALLFLIYSQLGTQVLSMFDCYPTPISGVHPLLASMSVPCYNTSHIIGMAFGVFFGIFYILGIPALAMHVIYKHRHQLQEDHIIRAYGFLYSGYLEAGVPIYWESVVMFRKVGLMIILIFVESGENQNFYASLLLVAALLLQLFFLPYGNTKLNAAESLSLLVSFLTQNLSILFWDHSGSNPLAISIVIVVINLFFLLFLLINIIQAIYIERIKEKGLHLRDLPKKLVQQLSFIPSVDDLLERAETEEDQVQNPKDVVTPIPVNPNAPNFVTGRSRPLSRAEKENRMSFPMGKLESTSEGMVY